MTNIIAITNIAVTLTASLITNSIPSITYDDKPEPPCAICGVSHHTIRVTDAAVVQQKWLSGTFGEAPFKLLLSEETVAWIKTTNVVATPQPPLIQIIPYRDNGVLYLTNYTGSNLEADGDL